MVEDVTIYTTLHTSCPGHAEIKMPGNERILLLCKKPQGHRGKHVADLSKSTTAHWPRLEAHDD